MSNHHHLHIMGSLFLWYFERFPTVHWYNSHLVKSHVCPLVFMYFICLEMMHIVVYEYLLTPLIISPLYIHFDVEYIYGFVWWGVCRQSRWRHSVTVPHTQDGGYVLLWQRYDNNKMAAICYYGNVMATTRWQLCVTMETLSQHSHNVSSITHAGCLHVDRTIQIHQ